MLHINAYVKLYIVLPSINLTKKLQSFLKRMMKVKDARWRLIKMFGRLYYQSACCFGRLEGLVWKVTWPDCLKVWLGRSHDQTVAWPGLAGHMARLFDGCVWQVTWPDCLIVMSGRSHGQTVWWFGLAGHMARLFDGLVWQVTWPNCWWSGLGRSHDQTAWWFSFFGWSHGQTAWWFGLAGLTVNPT